MNNEHMSELDPTAPISEQAAHWCVLFRGGSASRADRKAFGEWVSRSPERVEAYLEAARLTTALTSGKIRWPDTPIETLVRDATATAADVVSLFPPAAVSTKPVTHRSRRSRLPWVFATAAAVLAAVLCTWFFLTAPQRYATAVGEQRSIVLNDGSVITLNTSSIIQVTLAKTRRTIRLVAGEALFQVAHDKTRPFDVIAGDTTVRAVGTQFNVDRRASRTTVTVVEGKVSVQSAAQAPGSSDASGGGPIPVSAGEELVVSPQALLHAATANVAAATAWTQRRLVFERRPLGEVAAEFNRYNLQQMHIDSVKLESQEVTGTFQANDPNSFLDFVAKIPGVRIERRPGSTEVVLVN
jgi:transmembrane sensor